MNPPLTDEELRAMLDMGPPPPMSLAMQVLHERGSLYEKTGKGGFASMSAARRKEVASQGGKASQAPGSKWSQKRLTKAGGAP